MYGIEIKPAKLAYKIGHVDASKINIGDHLQAWAHHIGRGYIGRVWDLGRIPETFYEVEFYLPSHAAEKVETLLSCDKCGTPPLSYSFFKFSNGQTGVKSHGGDGACKCPWRHEVATGEIKRVWELGKNSMKQKFHNCTATTNVLPKSRQDFHHRVTLKFEDGSKAVFEYAFARVIRGNAKRVEVYTEHCGYHAFPLASLIEVVQERYGRIYSPKNPPKSRDYFYFLEKHDDGGETGMSVRVTGRTTYRK